MPPGLKIKWTESSLSRRSGQGSGRQRGAHTWILSQPLRREWFFERRDGNCRLMAQFATRLAETAQVWARAVAPVAEWVARQLWSTTRKRMQSNLPPTRLTQSHRREAKGIVSALIAPVAPRIENLCRGCGLPSGVDETIVAIAPLAPRANAL